MKSVNSKSRSIDFSALLEEIEAFEPLARVAEDLGVSRTHLVNLKNGFRKEPGYFLGAAIVEYHRKVISRKFDHIKARIKNGWQM